MPAQPHKRDCNTVHALEKPCPKPCRHDWVQVTLGSDSRLEGQICTNCYSIVEIKFAESDHADKP